MTNDLNTGISFRQPGLASIVRTVLAASVIAAGMVGTASAQSPAADLLPRSIKQSGVLKIATSLVQPPYSFENERGEPQGIDIELMKAIGKKLGLEPKFTKIAFASIIPGIENGRFDVGANEIADTAPRREVVQFVNYYKVSYGVLVTAGTKGMSSSNLCGGHFAVTQGSAQVVLLETMSQECERAGKPAIKRSIFPDSATAKLAVSSARAQAFVSDKGTAAYLSKIPENNFAVLEGDIPNMRQTAGFAVGKTNHELAAAIRKALQLLMESGEYQEILKKYDATGAAIREVTINGG
jgi:polar amino acid transport system substrate-binding protein